MMIMSSAFDRALSKKDMVVSSTCLNVLFRSPYHKFQTVAESYIPSITLALDSKTESNSSKSSLLAKSSACCQIPRGVAAFIQFFAIFLQKFHDKIASYKQK